MLASRLSLLSFAALVVTLAAGCEQSLGGACNSDPSKCPKTGDEAVPVGPRLYVDPPFGVGFDCVSVGCAQTRTFHVDNRGGGEVAIRLVRLSVDSAGDFDISLASESGGEAPLFPSTDDPIHLSAGKGFDVVVKYTPSDAVADEGALWIDWYDGKTPAKDAAAERETIPITTRVLGEAAAELETPELNFGYVTPGETVTLPVRVTNTTEGSAVLAVEVPTFDPLSDPHFALAPVPASTIFVNPGETVDIPVSLSPDAVDWYSGVLYLPTNDGARPQLVVNLLGTSIQEPFFAVLQPTDWSVDFGQIRIGNTGTREVKLRNLGGQPLSVTATMPLGGDVGFATPIPLGTALPTIPPLGEVTFEVMASPPHGGDVAGQMRFATNDPTLPEDWLDLHVYGMAPEGIVSPASLAFGDIAQGWTSEAQTVYITNGGTGELTITGVSFELGSSSQVRLAGEPSLPVKLRAGDDPFPVSVFVQASTIGAANAALLVATDGIVVQDIRVPITANVVTCQQACPVANGVPSCEAGFCEIGSCLPAYFNADERFDTGCECGEDTVGTEKKDVGAFCSAGENVGPLADKCGSGNRQVVTRFGTLPTPGDEDLYFYHSDDGGSITCDTFGDSFKARAWLVDSPDVELCVRSASGGSGCGGENQRTCGLSSWDSSSGWGSDGDVDVTVWVRRRPGAPPMCGEYEVRFCANDDASGC